MGCASSKIDDLPAVQLCRDRLQFLDTALHQRYAFAEAHVAYIHSLKSIGDSLRRFFDSSGHPPVLTLPPEGKGKESGAPPMDVPGPGSGSGHLSNSNSGGHIDFHSDTDSDDDDQEHHLHDDSDDVSGSDAGGSFHHHQDNDLRESLPSGHLNPNPRMMMYEGMGMGMGPPGPGQDGFNPYFMGGPGGGYGFGYGNNNSSNTTTHMNFMRKHVTPSVSYQQKPVGVETVQMGDPSSSSSYYADYPGNYGYGGGFFGGPAQPVYPDPQRGMEAGSGWGGGMTSAAASSSSSKQQAPPPPPPPPSTSAWDFLNPFESIESSYPPYTPSRDSREVREEEGIPDLEDEVDFEHEVVKEVHGHQKLVDDNNSNGNDEKGVGVEDEVGPSESGDLYRGRGRASSSSSPEEESTPVEYEVHMVEKKVVGDEGKSDQGGKSGGGGSKPSFRNVFEVVREIQVQFERASGSGNEIAKVLEVGKLRYHRKNHAYQVSSKMLHVITPSLPSTSKDSGASLDPDEDVQLGSENLSATLQKLYLWEKKLFEEVKAEEKMRVLHDRKVQKLKRLDERGAESAKVDATRSVIRGLSTKIRIAIQIVDKISVKINNVRDGELWPQLKDLILGLCRMWKAMLECHHSQCQAIEGARDLDAIAFPNNPSDTQLEATLQLEHDLINWTCRFTEWVGAQKGFVRALNFWLFKCLLPEPEVTDDGVAPFSPGRAGAPPVFVICHQWNQSLERISETSEKEVVDSMRVFATMVWHFRERDKGELRQRMTANRDMERKVKNLEREDVKMQKEIQALDKKMVLSSGGSDGLLLSGNVVYQSDTSSKTSLQSGLLHIFEAMDRFTADSVQVYEELLQRSEEVVR